MIRVTQRYFDSIVRSINDTSRKISNNPNGSFIEQYNLHVAALNKLVLELEIVDNLSSDEAIAESERILNRINFFKSISGRL